MRKIGSLPATPGTMIVMTRTMVGSSGGGGDWPWKALKGIILGHLAASACKALGIPSGWARVAGAVLGLFT